MEALRQVAFGKPGSQEAWCAKLSTKATWEQVTQTSTEFLDGANEKDIYTKIKDVRDCVEEKKKALGEKGEVVCSADFEEYTRLMVRGHTTLAEMKMLRVFADTSLSEDTVRANLRPIIKTLRTDTDMKEGELLHRCIFSKTMAVITRTKPKM